jgi:N-acyl amino acid synthase of PEP-CTERM/exosortase system
MGLLREMYRTSLSVGITHWYAAMERRLAVLIRRYSFDFQPVGPTVSYHGMRIPHSVSIERMERRVCECRADVYRYFRAGLDSSAPADEAVDAWR